MDQQAKIPQTARFEERRGTIPTPLQVNIFLMDPPVILSHWSLPIGRLFGISFRLSYLVFVFAAAVAWQADLLSGLLACAIMLISLVVQQVGHLCVSLNRVFYKDPILLWPGGSFTASPPLFQSQDTAASSALGGLLASAILAGTSAILLNAESQFRNLLLVPFSVPAEMLPGAPIWLETLIWTFSVNWTLLVINLIPIRPFAASAFATGGHSSRADGDLAEAVSLRIGFVLAGTGLLIGIVFNLVFLTAAFTGVLLLLMHDHRRYVEAHVFREVEHRFRTFHQTEPEQSFDYSNYGSPEQTNEFQPDVHEEFAARGRSSATAAPQPNPVEEELDRILQKLHERGREALTPEELHTLLRLSDQFRNRRP